MKTTDAQDREPFGPLQENARSTRHAKQTLWRS